MNGMIQIQAIYMYMEKLFKTLFRMDMIVLH